MTTNLVTNVSVFSIDFDLLHKKEFPSDIYIVDYDLIFNGKILILIIEDFANYTREIMVVDFLTNEFI